jgi:integrase
MSSDAKRPLGTARNATNSQPAYRRLKRANGRHLAFVDLDGRRVYLGEWDSPQSKQAYQRLLVERSRGILVQSDTDEVFVAELLAAFADHARVYYREPDGAPGREVANFAPLVRLIHDLYGDQPASDFDARALKNVRQAMIDKGYARRTINRMVVRARSIFKWGVSEGLVPPTVLTSLSAVDGLRAGRTVARETPPVMPVTESQIETTLPYMPQVLQDMVRVQLYTGMRPGELCQMRATDIEVAGELWVYRPRKHKTQHRGTADRPTQIAADLECRPAATATSRPTESLGRRRLCDALLSLPTRRQPPQPRLGNPQRPRRSFARRCSALGARSLPGFAGGSARCPCGVASGHAPQEPSSAARSPPSTTPKPST